MVVDHEEVKRVVKELLELNFPLDIKTVASQAMVGYLKGGCTWENNETIFCYESDLEEYNILANAICDQIQREAGIVLTTRLKLEKCTIVFENTNLI